MNIQDKHVCKVHVEKYKLCLYFMLFTYDFFCFTWRSKVYGFVQVYKFSPSLLYICLWYWFFTVAVLYMVLIHLLSLSYYSLDSFQPVSTSYIQSWFIHVMDLYIFVIHPSHHLIYDSYSSQKESNIDNPMSSGVNWIPCRPTIA